MENENITINDILGQTEQQSKEEYNNFRVAKIREKLYYPVLRGGVSPEQLKNIADSVIKEELNSVISLPGYIPTLLNNFANSSVGVAVVVGYPFGEGDIDMVIRAVKTFAKKPVSEIVTVLSLSDLKFCKARKTERILKLLSSVGKKKKVSVMLDCSRFITEDLEKVIRIISSYNLTNIYITTGFYGEDFSSDVIQTVKKSLKKPIKIISGAQDLSTEETVTLLKDTDGVFTSKSVDLIRELKQSM
ncbi:MAG TPA: hypothetical protein DDY82_03295 [Clostridiales bacterium]|nr:hypothetical protein [Clostridiales bacterium]HBJ98076.1 hypothetical protein [Clostridiales bacterium]